MEKIGSNLPSAQPQPIMNKIWVTVFLILVFGTQASGQQDTTTVDLGEFILQENRMEIPFNKTSRNISVIGRKAIETTPARSLQEVLSFTPGVDVRQRGVSGVQANIGIRGGSFEQTLMLLNGIKLTDPQTGHHMMNIPVPLQAIQRVEVLKGPGSRIFGQNAYAGAINIITELPETSTFRMQAYGGDFGTWGGHIISSAPIGKYKQTISLSRDQSNGHWHNSDFRVSNLFYESGMDINSKNEFRMMAGFTERDFGANGFYTPSFPDQWEATETYLASISHTYRSDRFHLQTRAYWRQNNDEFRLRRFEPSFYTNLHTSDVFALESNGTYQSKLGTTGFGLEGRKENIESTNLGERNRQFIGVFAEHRKEIGDKFDVRLGIYSNYYDQYKWKHFPGAEVGYQLSTASRLYANYGASFRIPSFTELYYQDPSNSSNPNLLPEEAQTYEVGWKVWKPRLRTELVYFVRRTQNLIDYVRQPSETNPNPNPWTPENITAVDFHGIESSIQYLINWGGGKAKLTEVNVSYNYINADLNQAPGLESRYSLNSLRHQFIAGVQAEFLQRAELTVKTRYIERMALDPYFLLDARLDYNRLKKFGFFVEISNITDTDYVEAGWVQMPGRWAKAGVMVNLY